MHCIRQVFLYLEWGLFIHKKSCSVHRFILLNNIDKFDFDFHRNLHSTSYDHTFNCFPLSMPSQILILFSNKIVVDVFTEIAWVLFHKYADFDTEYLVIGHKQKVTNAKNWSYQSTRDSFYWNIFLPYSYEIVFPDFRLQLINILLF